MRRGLAIQAGVVLLTASFCNAQTRATTAQEDNANLYSQLIRAEMKAGKLGQHDTVCLALPHSAPSKSLLKTLRSDGLSVHKPDRCLFRGYEIRVEQSTPDSIRVQLVDVRCVDTDLAVILRDGVYAVKKDTTGKWSTSHYTPLQPFDGK